jgi:hypothetical protein
MTPKQLTSKAPAPPLTKKEQQALPRVKEKIGKIQTDMANPQGLDDDEVKLAAKVGLIDPGGGGKSGRKGSGKRRRTLLRIRLPALSGA